LVLNPRSKIRFAVSGCTPGPESATVTCTSVSSAVISTLTDALARLATASSALSTRFPTTVATSVDRSAGSRGQRVAGEISNPTRDSAARLDLATSSAASGGSSMRAVTAESTSARRRVNPAT